MINNIFIFCQNVLFEFEMVFHTLEFFVHLLACA